MYRTVFNTPLGCVPGYPRTYPPRLTPLPGDTYVVIGGQHISRAVWENAAEMRRRQEHIRLPMQYVLATVISKRTTCRSVGPAAVLPETEGGGTSFRVPVLSEMGGFGMVHSTGAIAWGVCPVLAPVGQLHVLRATAGDGSGAAGTGKHAAMEPERMGHPAVPRGGAGIRRPRGTRCCGPADDGSRGRHCKQGTYTFATVPCPLWKCRCLCLQRAATRSRDGTSVGSFVGRHVLQMVYR